jgi:N-acyl-D-amino-acid deacylase
MSEFDVIIEETNIVDGTGAPPFKGSIGVKGNKIDAVGEVKGDAVKVVDGANLITSPGWIDAHSHGDSTVLFYPKAQNYVMQGVTTLIGGQCGFSPAPLGDSIGLLFGPARDYLDELEPHKYYPQNDLFPRERVNELMKEKFGWTIDWDTMGEWFQTVESKGVSMNLAPLVGHGTVRYKVMGNDFKRFSTEGELEEIKTLVKQAMEEGCIGLSTGLDYDPGVWASMDEIKECILVIKDYDGIYCPHWRRTGRRRDVKIGDTRANKVAGLLESIETCRQTGVPTNIAHLTPLWRLVPEGNDMMEEINIRATLKFIDDARSEGLQLTFDSMPWFILGGFGVMPYLCSLLTPWLKEQGSREKLAEWLKVPDYRKEVVDAISSGKWFIRLAYNPNSNPQWAENLWVVKHESDKCENKTIAQIAEEREKGHLETYFDLICEDPDCRGVGAGVGESGNFPWKPYRASFFKHPAGALSLDQTIVDHTRQQETPPYHIPGINAFSAFPAFLIKFVRELKLFTLEEAVRKMSTLAAEHHGLRGRGKLTGGGFADMVVFSLNDLKVLGDPVEPRRYPEGIKHVFVNGEAVVENGTHTGATPGKIVKKEA